MHWQWWVDWVCDMLMKGCWHVWFRNIAEQISVEERDSYWRRSGIYRHWLLDRVFKANSNDFITIMVFPTEVGNPKLPWCGTTVATLSCWAATKYWQTFSGPYPYWVVIPRWTWLQWCEHLSSPLWVSLPDEVSQVYSQVLLVGEITYNSVVTRREEPLPIGVSVIGAPGV